MGAPIDYPKKTREVLTAINDSTRWNGFQFRDDDIVIATWAKSGTTWMQQIVSQLLTDGRDEAMGSTRSPWLDLRSLPLPVILDRLDAQRDRRFIKTHLPVDALGIRPSVRYIYVARDPRDVVWSMYDHQSSYTDRALAGFNHSPGRVGPPVTHPPCGVREYYLRWLDTGAMPGLPMPPYWENVRSWWNVRHLPNVLLVHFDDLRSDLRRAAERIAGFLGVTVPSDAWSAIVEHCSFAHMQAETDKIEMLRAHFTNGGRVFVNKGTNGRWKDVLSSNEIARCDEIAIEMLGRECAHWLTTAELPR